VDASGGLHLAWMWRDSADAGTNHDLAYARSTDGGKTWTRSDGSPYQLPITAASAEYAARIPAGSNLMNPPSIAADGQGRPCMATYWSPAPGAPPRFHLVRREAGGWSVTAGPARSATFALSGAGTKRPPISRAARSLVVSPGALRLAAQPHTPAAPAAAGLDRAARGSDVLAAMQRVADWQLAHMPDPAQRHPRGWETAPFYIALLALDRIASDRRYQEAMVRLGDANLWQPHRLPYHADDQCVIQAYLDTYRIRRDPKMLAPAKQRLDYVLAHPSSVAMDWDPPACQERWTWCDALFMAPTSWLEMWDATGDRAYLDFMNREWWATTERLFNPATGLFFRDESFLDLREPNGRPVHWSRGNGWVFAGLARVLQLFPGDHPDYPRYRNLYLAMAKAVLAAQQSDGLWRPGLLDAAAHPERETSGSAFYAFGLAWGVNHALLDRNRVAPAVRRAWNALTHCVTPDGKLEHVQPIGAGPHGFDPGTTEPFAVGAFLLAGSEVYRLTGGV